MLHLLILYITLCLRIPEDDELSLPHVGGSKLVCVM